MWSWLRALQYIWVCAAVTVSELTMHSATTVVPNVMLHTHLLYLLHLKSTSQLRAVMRASFFFIWPLHGCQHSPLQRTKALHFHRATLLHCYTQPCQHTVHALHVSLTSCPGFVPSEVCQRSFHAASTAHFPHQARPIQEQRGQSGGSWVSSLHGDLMMLSFIWMSPKFWVPSFFFLLHFLPILTNFKPVMDNSGLFLSLLWLSPLFFTHLKQFDG